MRPYASLLQGPLASLALACAATVLGCAAIELGYRAHTGRPVFVLGDWRSWRIEYLAFGDRTTFDPVLGWVPKAWHESNGSDTLGHGIRRNFEEEGVRIGAILAVGGSLADGGTGVADGETWPAQLERMAGAPVLNAAVSGYATDQIVMRAEQLLPLVKPKTLILGFGGGDISAAGRLPLGTPKPYFTLDGGKLKYHLPVVQFEGTTSAWRARTREILGYSAVFDAILARLAPDYWTGAAGQEVLRMIDNDPVGITCALLQRVKTRTDADGIRLLLFMQHRPQMLADTQEPGDDAKKVGQCATTIGVSVVDEFEPLRAVAVASPGALRDLYLKGDDQGLMSAKGNRHAAELLARALGKQP
jgi:hypothetical protein